MILASVKSLFYKNSSEKTFKLLFYNKNYKNTSLDINYEIELNCRRKDLKKNENFLRQKELIIIGLNWKLVRASDIFSILKPFVCNTGKINYVSILSHGNKQKKLSYEDRPQFNSFFNTQISKKIRSRGEIVKIFARICCDSNKTLNKLYKKCNKIEIENVNEVFDMRFIKFDLLHDTTVIESVDKVSKSYYPTYLKIESFSQKNIRPKTKDIVNQYKNLNETTGVNKIKFLKKIKSSRTFKFKKLYSPVFYGFSNNKEQFLAKNRNFQLDKKFLFGKFFINLKI